MADQRLKRISIVVPFYNEEAGIDIFHKTLTEHLGSMPAYDFEIVCVDDGSRDRTLEQLKELVVKDPRFVVLELSRNFGKEIAMTAGLDAATGDAAIPMDADLQDPPEMIAQLIAEWQKGYEVVLAKRADRSSDTYLKQSDCGFVLQGAQQVLCCEAARECGRLPADGPCGS